VGKLEGISPGDVESDDAPEDPIAGDGDNEGPETETDTAESDDDGESGPSSEGELDGETDDDPDPDAEPDAEKAEPAAPEELPEGFKTREELIAAAKASRQHEAELARYRAAFLAQQRQQQTPPEKPKPWVPGADDPEVVRAWELVSEDPDAAKRLAAADPALAGKVQSLDRQIAGRWRTYQRDPDSFVRDHVIPRLEGSVLVQKVRELESVLKTIQGRELLQQHKVTAKEDRQALYELLNQGMNTDTALRHLAMQRELAALKKGQGKNPGAQAQRDKDRANQAAKKGGQRPGRPGQAPKTTNAIELAEWARRVHENK
jgi:hypothetical protein